MNYTAQHIDTEKFEAGLESHKRYQEELHRTAVEKANAQYEGYCKCLEDVREMLHCSNYEKSVADRQDHVQREADFTRGVNAVFSWIGEELGMETKDIVQMDVGVEVKSEVMVQRLALYFKDND
jgi:hypothetical protein